jgi:hypothetical protein
VRRLKYFSRKRPVTAQPSLALTAANSVSRRITETRARKRARNSYIRDHEHPPGSTHRTGYELITTAPRPRTAALPRSRQRPGGHDRWRQPPRPAPITQTAKPVACSPTDLHRDLSYGQGRRTCPCPGRCPRRPDRAASTGRNQTGLDRSCDADSGVLRGTRELPTGSCGH